MMVTRVVPAGGSFLNRGALRKFIADEPDA